MSAKERRARRGAPAAPGHTSQPRRPVTLAGQPGAPVEDQGDPLALLHQAKNALTGIVGFVELLPTRPAVQSDPSAMRFVSEVLEDARLLAQTLEHLQDRL